MTKRLTLLIGLSSAVAACVALQDLGDRPVPEGGGPDSDTARLDASAPIGASAPDATSEHDSGAFTSKDGMILIAGGPFRYARGGSVSQTRLTYDFWIDTHEVTIARFDAWKKAGQPAPCSDTCSLDPGGPYATDMVWSSAREAKLGQASYQTTTDPLSTYGHGDLLPMNRVNWYQAIAVCAFEGKRLLTNTEWQYVAVGANEGRKFPWGGEEPKGCDRAIWSLGLNSAFHENGCNFPTPVGRATGDLSRDGVHDLGGSLSEWVFDIGSRTVGEPPQLPDNPILIDDSFTSWRTIRGGNFYSSAADIESGKPVLESVAPDSYRSTLGFRCAKTRL